MGQSKGVRHKVRWGGGAGVSTPAGTSVLGAQVITLLAWGALDDPFLLLRHNPPSPRVAHQVGEMWDSGRVGHVGTTKPKVFMG